MRGFLVAVMGMGIGFSVVSQVFAQQSRCFADGNCGSQPCQILPSGMGTVCNCCPPPGSALPWTCCDNVPCNDCFLH